MTQHNQQAHSTGSDNQKPRPDQFRDDVRQALALRLDPDTFYQCFKIMRTVSDMRPLHYPDKSTDQCPAFEEYPDVSRSRYLADTVIDNLLIDLEATDTELEAYRLRLSLLQDGPVLTIPDLTQFYTQLPNGQHSVPENLIKAFAIVPIKIIDLNDEKWTLRVVADDVVDLYQQLESMAIPTNSRVH